MKQNEGNLWVFPPSALLFSPLLLYVTFEVKAKAMNVWACDVLLCGM